jgi:hypothetical protein
MEFPMRRFLLAVFFQLLSMISIHAQQAEPKPALKIGPVELCGFWRTRYEAWGWFDVPGHDGTNDFGATTFRFGIRSKHKLGDHDSLDWQAEMQFTGLLGLPRNAVAPAPQGALGLGGNYDAANPNGRAAIFPKQVFLRWTHVGATLTTTVRVGRFEFSDGAELPATDARVGALKRQRIQERLIGPFFFTHVGRAFDGFQISSGTTRANITLFAARPTEGVFQLDGTKNLPGVAMFYGAFTRAIKPVATPQNVQYRGDWRVFATFYRDSRGIAKTDSRPAPFRTADRFNPIDVTTVGGHYVRIFTPKLKATVDVLGWGAAQFGKWGNLDHRAGAGAVEAGVQFDVKWKPWLRGGFFGSTGDGNPDDATHGTFFQLLPTPRPYARTPFYNAMNNRDMFAQLQLRPHQKLTLKTEIHRLWLSSSSDLWYVGGGAFQRGTFGYVGRPSKGSRDLGTLLDLSADVQVNQKLSVNAYFGRIFGGRIVNSIYPLGSLGFLMYIESVFRL